ncbi:MAG: DNA phosphorothioation-associated protein 4 [Cyanobacterium sp. T60_A2020_053]|nr:DNA phosphorothioation-associated protein 4 [Cyanobacterium sp. T60_A2020_053]
MSLRVRIAQDKAPLVLCLVHSHNHPEGVFSTYADLMAFAAAVGTKYHYRQPLESIAKEPSPISLEVFISRGYDLLIKMIAITETKNPQIISPHYPNGEEERVVIFEEYANGGLSQLSEQVKGAVSYQERILLWLNQHRAMNTSAPEDFDLTRFLS